MTKFPRASLPVRTLVMAFALMSGGAPAALGQDATTSTPPELRDFRLDPPPAEREPLPETTPPMAPAPSPAPTQSRPTPAPVVVPPPVSAAPRTQDEPSSPAPRTESRAPDETQRAPEPVLDVTAEPLPTSTLPPTESVREEKQAAASDDMTRIGGVIMLLLLAAAGGFYYYRRRTKGARAPMRAAIEVAPRSRPKPRQAPSEPARMPPPLPPTRAPIPLAEPVIPSRQSSLSMTFVPDNAVVSLANLSIRGQLQVANEGPDIIEGLTLRAVLIAASAQQQQAIESFFADPGRIPPSSVGTLNPGERIGLTLELSVALHEMQTFVLGDKTLLVPILLAHLSYDNAAPEQEAQLVTMIGREANPPAPKMGPLRLDLGPRTFGQLGHRPLPA